MHVFTLQYRQLPGVNCVCRYHGGSLVQLAVTVSSCTTAQNVWSGSLSSLKLGWLAKCRPTRSMLT